MDDFKHYTVMLNEAVDALNCEDGKIMYMERLMHMKIFKKIFNTEYIIKAGSFEPAFLFLCIINENILI